MKQHQMHVPLDLLQRPISGECLIDAFWMVHPDKGALYVLDDHQASYSGAVREACNRDERLVHRFLQADHVVQQIPVAYLAHGARLGEEFRKQLLADRKADRG